MQAGYIIRKVCELKIGDTFSAEVEGRGAIYHNSYGQCLGLDEARDRMINRPLDLFILIDRSVREGTMYNVAVCSLVTGKISKLPIVLYQDEVIFHYA